MWCSPRVDFVSFPVVLASWIWRIPVVAHESDLTPGLANRLSLPFVKTLCVNFPVTRPARFDGEVIYTGTPIRPALAAGSAEQGRRLLGVTADRRIIVVTGGSLGADRLNEAGAGCPARTVATGCGCPCLWTR